MAAKPRKTPTWERIANIEDLPDGWVRDLAKDPAVMARIIAASQIGPVKIVAHWDRGYAWNVWSQNMGSGWYQSENGMHSQMPVSVYLSAHRVWQTPDGSWDEADFPEEEIGQVSFWNWG